MSRGWCACGQPLVSYGCWHCDGPCFKAYCGMCERQAKRG